MDQLYAQSLNLIDTLAQKHHVSGLSDFEYKLHEQLCEAMATYFGGLKFAFKISSMKTEMECAKEEKAYLEWLDEVEKAEIERERTEKETEGPTPEE